MTEFDFSGGPIWDKQPHHHTDRIPEDPGEDPAERAARLAAQDQAAQATDEPARTVTLTKASSFKLKRVRWAWEGRVPAGALSLIAGPEGLGKSTLGYWIAARITKGELPGEHHGTPKSVLIAATEDSWEHTIAPRLIAAGADLDRVYKIGVKTSLGTHSELTLPKDIDGLEQATTTADAALLILDPLLSRISGNLDTHRDAEVRLALEPIASIADKTGLAVIGLMHFNKSGADSLNSVMASKAFTAVARAVSTVIKDPDDEDEQRRLFGMIKSNLGSNDLPLKTFQITSHKIDSDDGEIWTGRLGWLDDITGTMDDALQRGRDGTAETVVEEVSEWLTDYINQAGGCATRPSIIKAGRAVEYTEDQLKRARKRLGLISRRAGFQTGSHWMTPEYAAANPDETRQ